LQAPDALSVFGATAFGHRFVISNGFALPGMAVTFSEFRLEKQRDRVG